MGFASIVLIEIRMLSRLQQSRTANDHMNMIKRSESGTKGAPVTGGSHTVS